MAILTTSTLLMQTMAQPLPTPPSAPDGIPAPEAQPTVPGAPAAGATPQRVVVPQKIDKPEKIYSFKFEGADLETVMQTYCEWTGKIYLKNDAVKAAITLKADNLTKKECIEVVDAILGMNNIALVPMGDKFLKVVQSTAPDLGGQGLKINMDPEQEYAGTDKIVTQIIQLKNVQIPEVQTAVQHLMHAYGKIQTLERSNSLMVTDTESNMLRIRDLIEFLDQASARIEPRIYDIHFADATEIAAKLNEIITMAQGDQKTPGGVPAGTSTIRTPPGVIRARAAQEEGLTTPTQATISKTEGSSTVIIQGTVKVMADERTNIVLIFSQKENFDFFDNIIKVLDVEVEPAVTFEVVNLEYADAEELASTLNDLVGAATGSRSSSSTSSSSTGGTSSKSSSKTSSSRSSKTSSSRSNSTPQNSGTSQMVAPKTEGEAGATPIENLSRLSEDTKILADKRSNAILLMGQKADIAAIKTVIAQLDVMLEQVMIEAAIFEIGLSDSLKHGIEWLYQSQDGNKVGAWDGNSLITNAVGNIASGALTYYQNLTGINTKLAVNLAATDNNARLLATPVIMTTDNTEAKLSIGEQRPVVTSTDSFANSSGTQRSNYEYKDIGIQLTITPRINPQRFVVMELVQTADQLGGNVSIDGNDVPIILNREFEASIAVPDRGTVALGGLISSEWSDDLTKIPILGDIPLLGRYLFSSVKKTESRRELIVLMTPYVLTNPLEMEKETERIYKATDITSADWTAKGWSDSKLQFIPDPEEPVQEQ